MVFFLADLSLGFQFLLAVFKILHYYSTFHSSYISHSFAIKKCTTCSVLDCPQQASFRLCVQLEYCHEFKCCTFLILNKNLARPLCRLAKLCLTKYQLPSAKFAKINKTYVCTPDVEFADICYSNAKDIL